MEIKLGHLCRFYPYESAHVSRAGLIIKDTDSLWYKALDNLLNQVDATKVEKVNGNGFNVSMDNKITLGFRSVITDNLFEIVYITYWDNTVYIGGDIHFFNKKDPEYALIRK